jgi:hypothetical protein
MTRQTADERFASRVTIDDEGCWVWRGDKKKRATHMKVDGRQMAAYRWVYERDIGPIPDGFTIDHLCRNPGCVNPQHLEPVTIAENVARARRDYAADRDRCVSGRHPWPESAVRLGKAQRLQCEECRNERRRKNRDGVDRAKERYATDPEYRGKVLARNSAWAAKNRRKRSSQTNPG